MFMVAPQDVCICLLWTGRTRFMHGGQDREAWVADAMPLLVNHDHHGVWARCNGM